MPDEIDKLSVVPSGGGGPPELQRIRSVSQFLDQCIPLPFGQRMGFDPIIGLIPGIGDFLTSIFSCYAVVEAYRLGIPKRILLLMVLNIAADALVGTVPIAGDVVDVFWKANIRNLKLVEASYRPGLTRRSVLRVIIYLGIAFAVIGFGLVLLGLMVLNFIRGLFG